jgi:copper resistance protein B
VIVRCFRRLAINGMYAIASLAMICPQACAESPNAPLSHDFLASSFGAEVADSSSAADSGGPTHVAPDPPKESVPPMSYKHMASMMQMDDRERVGAVQLDQFEWRNTQEGNAVVWEAQAWYGNDHDKLWVKSEGERIAGATQGARADVLWDRLLSRWWNLQAGVRQDFGMGPSRTWAAVGLQGLAPYWIDVEATFYVGEQGRTALRFKSEYDLLLTQRLILQPEAEIELYGKSDPEKQIGSGLSDLDLGFRLRYEIRRELAPYAGLAWHRLFGASSDLARAAHRDSSDVQAVAGVRIFF